MPRRVAELASRVEELQAEVDRLLDEYVETRRRLRTVERQVGTGEASTADDLDLDLGVESGTTDGPGASTDPDESDAPADPNQESAQDEAATEGETPEHSEQASPDDVAEAVQSVDGDPEDENEEESSGLDDIIIA